MIIKKRLLETVKIENGELKNIYYHNERMNRSRRIFFGAKNDIDISKLKIDIPIGAIYRLRILYTLYIEKIEILPYRPKNIKKLKIVEASFDYSFKYENRSCFEKLFESYSGYDDFILTRDGFLTDTTIANIALKKDNRWFTPKTPLLGGTVRNKLLDENVLIPKDISKEDIKSYDELALMNAMIGFKRLEISPKDIDVN